MELKGTKTEQYPLASFKTLLRLALVATEFFTLDITRYPP